MPTVPVSKDILAQLAERLNWTTAETEISLQGLVKDIVHHVGGENLKRALHGDWLNEPLHALLTDVPVGAWSATVTFDTIAGFSGDSTFAKTMDNAADATLVLGLIGAVAAAITGIHDWSEIETPVARKVGLVHAGINMAAIALFVASGFHRLRKERSIARFLSGSGYVALMVGAHLGGNLVYEHGVGVQSKPDSETVTIAAQ